MLSTWNYEITLRSQELTRQVKDKAEKQADIVRQYNKKQRSIVQNIFQIFQISNQISN